VRPSSDASERLQIWIEIIGKHRWQRTHDEAKVSLGAEAVLAAAANTGIDSPAGVPDLEAAELVLVHAATRAEVSLEPLEHAARLLATTLAETGGTMARKNVALLTEALEATTGGLDRYREDQGPLTTLSLGWTPRQAWLLSTWRMSELITKLVTSAPSPTLPERSRLLLWHRALFSDLGAPGVGHFSDEATQFTLRIWDSEAPARTVPLRATAPAERDAALDRTVAPVRALVAREYATVAEVADVAAAWYLGFLLIHPFADGNQRVGWVGLSAIASACGLGVPVFDLDAHDRALGQAHLDTSHEPLAALLRAIWTAVQS
jgi:fido (protein-threonine AMPylation protein)